MSLNSRDNQTDKKALQAKDKANSAKQGSKAEKSSNKTGTETKKKGYQGRHKKPNPATGANTAPAATGGEKKKKKKKDQDVSEITSYSCNKKGYYASNYTKPKN